MSNVINDEMYKELLRKMDLVPLTYKEIAEDWIENEKEWYHAMIADEDLSTVMAIPTLRIYSWC